MGRCYPAGLRSISRFRFAKLDSMRTLITLLSAISLLAGCAIAPVSPAPRLVPIAVPEGATPRTLDLHSVITRLPLEEAKFNVRYGMLCEVGRARSLPSGRLPVSDSDLAQGFRRVLEPLRFRIAAPSETVFSPTVLADLQIGATVTRVEANFCFPFSGSPLLNVGAPDLAKGNVFMQVVWEAYSPSGGKVVFKHTTTGAFSAQESLPGGVAAMFLNAFTENLRNLAADPSFHTLVRAPRPPAKRAPEDNGAEARRI